MNRQNIKKKAAIISLSVGIGMFIAKMGGFLVTGSAAIFSDAAESVVHVLATSMALYSIILSSKPADESHLYGHKNIEFFSAGTEGILIIIAALVIIYTAIVDIVKGSELKNLDIGIYVVSTAGIINLFLGTYLVRMGKKTSSLTLVADGKHVLTDSYTSIGVLVGVILVFITGYKILDPLFAIGVALNILVTGYKLVRQSVGGLMKETDLEILKKIADILINNKKDYWIDLHELRYWQSGDQIFLDFHLILPYYFTIQKAHEEEKEIERIFLEEFPNLDIMIHFDYCKPPDVCKYCNYQVCDVRKDDFKLNFNWDIEKLTGSAIYLRQ